MICLLASHNFTEKLMAVYDDEDYPYMGIFLYSLPLSLLTN